MPGFLGGSSSNSSGQVTIYPNATLLDPVSKLRVSEPQTMMDTDFEYGLQPTKWETVELINNTPSFFSASGDTTLPNLNDMTTTAGSREVKVTTLLPHGVSVGIPINVTGSKSLTADGSYIINSVPDTTTFTYLCKGNQLVTASIIDLYTSIITGQFFQGSQIKISDSQGLVTDANASSTLTITLDSPHGFGVNTPFYFLNLNSTVSQEFDASNTGAKTFDSSNTATAQSFDGSNTLTSYAIDLTNQANANGSANTSSIVATNTTTDTVTVTHTAETFNGKQIGTPLYYNVAAASGYFNTNPRGIVFLKSTVLLGASSSEFQVSATPGGTAIDLTVTLTGTFQLADQARLFAGNNTDTTNQTNVDVVLTTPLAFDGANTLGSTSTINSASNGSAIIQMTNNAGSTTDTGLYVNAMVFYSTTGTAITGLTNNTTYWVNYLFLPAGTAASGLVQIKLAATPGGADIVMGSSYTGTHTIKKIGVSIDKDYLHVPSHGLILGDMIKYNYPTGGAITRSNSTSDFMYVSKIADTYNIQLKTDKGTTPDGLSAASPGVSAAQLKADNGYNTDGIYYITINGTAQPVYCIMNSAINGGGWMMAMKATRGTTFEYSTSYWTTNNLLNYTVGSTTNVNRNDGDAKFDVMNYFAAKDILALWPDIGQGGSVSVSGYPWIWLENDYYSGTRITPISFFSTVDRLFKRDAKSFSGWAAGVFSSQVDIRFYGFNFRGYSDAAPVRWGFGWNENNEGLYSSVSTLSAGVDPGSDDVSGGIGMRSDWGGYSAGDTIHCCQDTSGINRSARVEVYVR
jgi:hypothetical protein